MPNLRLHLLIHTCEVFNTRPVSYRCGMQSVMSAFPRKAWERAKSVFVGWVEARRQHNECRVLCLSPTYGLGYALGKLCIFYKFAPINIMTDFLKYTCIYKPSFQVIICISQIIQYLFINIKAISF